MGSKSLSNYFGIVLNFTSPKWEVWKQSGKAKECFAKLHARELVIVKYMTGGGESHCHPKIQCSQAMSLGKGVQIQLTVSNFLFHLLHTCSNENSRNPSFLHAAITGKPFIFSFIHSITHSLSLRSHMILYNAWHQIWIHVIQCVPLATEPGISLIILTSMKILQEFTFVVWEMKLNVSVVSVCSQLQILLQYPH